MDYFYFIGQRLNNFGFWILDFGFCGKLMGSVSGVIALRRFPPLSQMTFPLNFSRRILDFRFCGKLMVNQLMGSVSVPEVWGKNIFPPTSLHQTDVSVASPGGRYPEGVGFRSHCVAEVPSVVANDVPIKLFKTDFR